MSGTDKHAYSLIESNDDTNNNGFNGYSNADNAKRGIGPSATTSDIIIRQDAERRAKSRQETSPLKDRLGDRMPPPSSRRSKSRSPLRRETMLINAADVMNSTPLVAQKAEIDFKLNGKRARANTGDFIPPRWVPDIEVDNCSYCSISFDWVNRKHHCRHCGKIYCETCSCYRSLLPREFGISDPQRVCRPCHAQLLPIQHLLTHSIANHQKSNEIDKTNKCINNCINLPYSYTLESDIRKAAYTTYNLFTLKYIKDKAIPLKLISRAYGLAFLTVVKAGFGFGGKFGTGLVIGRLPNGEWSAPSAIATVGVIWGMLIGADITDYVIILNTIDALRAFSGSGQVSIGADIDVAIGPVGRSGTAEFNISDVGSASAFSYSHSRGLYAGLSLDGAIIINREGVNTNFYGRNVTPLEILSGQVSRPRAGGPLYEALREAMESLYDPNYSHKAQSQLNTTPIRLPSSSSAPDGSSKDDCPRSYQHGDIGDSNVSSSPQYYTPTGHDVSTSPFKHLSPTVFGSSASWVVAADDDQSPANLG